MDLEPTQIVLIVLIVVLIILYPVLMYFRNKKERQKVQEQTNSLKRGDKVLTTSGVYGTIIDLHLEEDKKIVTIETGTDNKKGYLSIDAYAIYTVFKEETVDTPTEIKQEASTLKDSNAELKSEQTISSGESEPKPDKQIKSSKKQDKKD